MMTEKELEAQASEWEVIQEAMGCAGCKFCDQSMLNSGPCCNYPGMVGQDERGRCTKKRGPARGC